MEGVVNAGAFLPISIGDYLYSDYPRSQ